MKNYFIFILFLIFTVSCKVTRLSQSEINKIKVIHPEKHINGELPMSIVFMNVQYLKKKKSICVEGKVIDTKTNDNLSLVSVIVSQRGYKKDIASSNNQGKFNFTTLFNKSDTIIFELPGYASSLFSYNNIFHGTKKK